jgi:hypothetical protein
MTSEVRNVGLLLLLAAATVLLAFQLPSDLFIDFGPNDSRHAQDFREDFEIDEPTLIHWTTHRSKISLPFHLNGPYDVTLRYKRHIARDAEIRLFLEGEPLETFVVPQQDFTLHTFSAVRPEAGPFELLLLARSEDARPLGLALDWMAIRPARRFGAILPSVGALSWILSWVLAFYLVPRLTGLGRRTALISALLAVCAMAALVAAHKFWPVHAASTLGLRAHVATAILVVFYRLRSRSRTSAFAHPVARWVIFAVFVGFAIRLFALFHPDFYYPDVRTHSKFVSIIWTEGLSGFFANHIANQHQHLLGLQYVGNRWVAFPYPPLLYLSIYPLSLLQLPVEDWMKLLPITLTAFEAILVFALATKLGVPARVAGLASILHATARVLAFRLAVASYAALFGHFWDCLTVLYLVQVFDRIERPRYAAGFAVLVSFSLLSYAGSALTLGLFVPWFCLALIVLGTGSAEKRRATIIAGWALLGAMAALLAFYWQYVPELFPGTEEIPPENGTGAMGQLIDFTLTPFAAMSMAAYRLALFYSPLFVILALSSVFMLRRRKPSTLAASLVVATVGTYLGLNFLRAGLGSTHIFQFSKDDLVVLPLFVVALAFVIERVRQSSPRGGPILAAMLIAGFVGWSALSLAEDVRSRFIRPDYPLIK